MLKRSSGILMPISALPSKYGIGTLGKCAYQFIDFLSAAGQKYWQLLPIGPTSYGDSPYSSFSTFAGNPYYIDLDMLIRDGLLRKNEVQNIDWGNDPERIDYGKIYNNRFAVLRLAYVRGVEKFSEELAQFCQENSWWLENYALYMAVKAKNNMTSWVQWQDEEIRMHRPEAVARYTIELQEEIGFYRFMQFLFFRQWNSLRAYAKEKGVDFIGDIPIYVAMDSADVWSEPQYFQLDEENRPVEVAGVPPDYFTADGQLWGNPLYDYDAMAKDGYGWWIRRVDGARKLYDVIRIDHFRGFESYWAVPAGDSTARNGRWRIGPGMNLVGVLTSWFGGLEFIAEDLGYTTDAVRKLLADSGLPGMKVMEFAFDPHGESDYLPYKCEMNSVCYLGTHDNDTVTGWLKSIDKQDKKFAADYMHITADEGWSWGMIRTGMATASNLFVMQMQDILELGPECRMNTPGSASGNWQWRMKDTATDRTLAKKLRRYTEVFGRV